MKSVVIDACVSSYVEYIDQIFFYILNGDSFVKTKKCYGKISVGDGCLLA
jgi:hypothetical protein